MREDYEHPVKGTGLTTEMAAAILVLGSLLLLILIRRGFRSVSIPAVGNISIG